MRASWWWVDRWRKSTAYTRLTLEEQGAYRNLLDELWLRDGVLENDERYLANVSGDAVRWPELRERVMVFFTLTDEGWRNQTHDEIAGESKKRADKQKRYRDRHRRVTGNVTGDVTTSPSPSPSPSKRQLPERDESAQEMWEEISRILKATIPTPQWSTWIRPTDGWGWDVLENGGRRLVVVVPPGQHRDWITNTYLERIRKLLAKRDVTVRLEEAE